ncbi:MAG: T9SS type A sorting domain-containing protein [candidate division WOR-3 bacterium]
MMVVVISQCAPVPAGTIVMFDGPPPAGWQVLTDFQDRFPLGTTTYGGTLGGTTSHTHTISGTTSSGTTIPNCGGPSWSITPMDPHTHTYSTTTRSANHIPPYRTFIFAKALVDFTYLPQNAVVLSYNAPTRPEWSDITSSMVDRFPMGNTTTPGLTGGTTSHTHTFSGTTSTNTSSSSDIADYGSTYDTPYSQPHSHTFSGTTSSANHIPPYRTVRFWKAISEPARVESCVVIFMFDTLPSCPYFSIDPNFDGRIPMANTTTGLNGGSSTHTHTYSFTTSTYYGPDVWTGGAVSSHLPHGHNHTASGTTSSADHMPPYRTVVFATYCGPLSYDDPIVVEERGVIDWRGKFSFKVYSSTGREMLKGESFGNINLSNLPKGVYIVFLERGGEKRVIRFVKRR